jgi:hypothetical protein
MSIASSQRNVGQKPPSLPHAKACSNHRNLHGTLIYSAQFLHRQIMSIFTKQYQHITELPSLVQHDDVVHKASASVTISEVVGDIRWTRLRPRFFLYRASMIRLLLSLLALVSGFAVGGAIPKSVFRQRPKARRGPPSRSQLSQKVTERRSLRVRAEHQHLPWFSCWPRPPS